MSNNIKIDQEFVEGLTEEEMTFLQMLYFGTFSFNPNNAQCKSLQEKGLIKNFYGYAVITQQGKIALSEIAND